MSCFSLEYSMVQLSSISMSSVAYVFAVGISFAELEKVEDLFCCLDPASIELGSFVFIRLLLHRILGISVHLLRQ